MITKFRVTLVAGDVVEGGHLHVRANHDIWPDNPQQAREILQLLRAASRGDAAATKWIVDAYGLAECGDACNTVLTETNSPVLGPYRAVAQVVGRKGLRVVLGPYVHNAFSAELVAHNLSLLAGLEGKTGPLAEAERLRLRQELCELYRQPLITTAIAEDEGVRAMTGDHDRFITVVQAWRRDMSALHQIARHKLAELSGPD